MDAASFDEIAIPVGEYASLGRAQEHALVIMAMNLSCWLGRGEEARYVLLAEPERAPAIAAELEAYDSEQAAAPQLPQVELPKFGAGLWLALAWVTVLMGVFLWQGRSDLVTDLGRSSSLAIFRDGEWWRAFTALFLHADLEHLMGNIVSGVAFGALACRSLGKWLAWPLIIASGIAGNLITAWAHFPAAWSSIGASTAVFGALGLLTGYGFYLAFRMPSSTPWASVIVPIGGGIALLGMTGAGGVGVDVMAHLAGFCCGLVAGAVAGWRQIRWLLKSP